MIKITKRSAVHFKAGIEKTVERDKWTVVLAYKDEGRGPYLVDLSHKTRWDLQDKNLSGFRPLGREVPADPGECHLQDGIMIYRMNRTQAVIWQLNADAAEMPTESAYTNVSDVSTSLALFGPNALSVVEKLCALDLHNPHQEPPFLLQGPFSHVPCHLVIMERGQGFDGGMLLTCSRGYADSMLHAILDAGDKFGLRAAGEQRFADWMERLSGRGWFQDRTASASVGIRAM